LAEQDNRSMTSVTELLGRYCKDNEVAGKDNRSRTLCDRAYRTGQSGEDYQAIRAELPGDS